MNYEEILEKAKEFNEVIPTIYNKELKNLANLISEEKEIKDINPLQNVTIQQAFVGFLYPWNPKK